MITPPADSTVLNVYGLFTKNLQPMRIKVPTVSIYISNEDYDKFRAIEKKSEFIHNALNPSFQVLNKSISEAINVSANLKVDGEKIMKARVDNPNVGLTDKMLHRALGDLDSKGIKPNKTTNLKSNRTKSNLCKQHGIDKNLCRMMKH